MKIPGTRSERGVALVEALLAALILAVGFLALTALEGRITLTVGGDKARAEAMELAKERSEELAVLILTDDFDDLVGSTTWSSDSTIPGKNADFNRRWRFTDDTTAALADMKLVEVEVNWSDSKGDTQRVVLVTNIANKPLDSSAESPQSNYGSVASPNAGSAEYTTPDGWTPTSPTLEHSIDTDGDGTTDTFVKKDTYDSDGDGTDDITIIWEEDSSGNRNIVLSVYTSLLTLDGTVYYDGDIEDLFVLASDAGYCAFPLSAGSASGGYESATYRCYIGSGWRGKVGLLGFSSATPLLCPYISRMYVKYIIDVNGNITGHTGITSSFALADDHNFLVKDGGGSPTTCAAEFTTVADGMAPALIVGNTTTTGINVYSITGTFTKRSNASDEDVEIVRVDDTSTTTVDESLLASCITYGPEETGDGDGLWTCTVQLPLDAGNTVTLHVKEPTATSGTLSRINVDDRLDEVTLDAGYSNTDFTTTKFIYDLSGLSTNVAVGPDIGIRR